jgi:catechol 2,3-dioxygenase-like lactoylglutathione lyase family enzyme
MPSSIPPRISLATLGVTDLQRSTDFYTALGWQRAEGSVAGVVTFFPTVGAALSLFGIADLAADADLPADAAPAVSTGFRGFSLAINLESREAVDAAFATAEAAGARIVKAPRAADWGGYSGYFADPDGHLWEIAHNPGWPLDERGLPVLH